MKMCIKQIIKKQRRMSRLETDLTWTNKPREEDGCEGGEILP